MFWVYLLAYKSLKASSLQPKSLKDNSSKKIRKITWTHATDRFFRLSDAKAETEPQAGKLF